MDGTTGGRYQEKLDLGGLDREEMRSRLCQKANTGEGTTWENKRDQGRD